VTAARTQRRRCENGGFSRAAAQDESNLRGQFGRFAQILLPTEYADGWLAESQAHVQPAYLGDWTSLNKVTVRGPQALEFLSWSGIRDLSRFEIGQVRHHVQLDSHGWVASEGILYRLGEEEFRYTAGSCDWQHIPSLRGYKPDVSGG
jgi:glycine cleavage system aminomethyltransferase T